MVGKINKNNRAIAIVLIVVVSIFIISVLTSLLIPVESIAWWAQRCIRYVGDHYVLAIVAYISVYSVSAMAGIPLLIPLSLMGGYLFGVGWATFYSFFAIMVGSIAYMYGIRYSDFGKRSILKMTHANKVFFARVDRITILDIVSMHFSLVIPLILINTLSAFSALSIRDICVAYSLGALPILFLYAYAGASLLYIKSFSEIIRPDIIYLLLIISFILCFTQWYRAKK